MVDIGSLSAKKNKHKEDGLGVNMWWGLEAGRGSGWIKYLPNCYIVAGNL